MFGDDEPNKNPDFAKLREIARLQKQREDERKKQQKQSALAQPATAQPVTTQQSMTQPAHAQQSMADIRKEQALRYEKERERKQLEEQKKELEAKLKKITTDLGKLEIDSERMLFEDMNEFEAELENLQMQEKTEIQRVEGEIENKRRFFIELDRRRNRKTNIDVLKRTLNSYDIQGLIDKYLNMSIYDPDNMSFYTGDLNNTLNTLELLYITGRYDFSLFMRQNNVTWHLESFEGISISTNVLHEINMLFQRFYDNPKGFCYIIQYYINDAINITSNDRPLDELINIIRQHMNILSNISPDKINSAKVNSFIGQQLIAGMDPEEIFIMLFDVIEQSGGKKNNFKLKYKKYNNKIIK
jgi:hypothetical protein